ncbi:MAG: hypothetical protein ABSE69_08175 [Roseiarcus sp.]
MMSLGRYKLVSALLAAGALAGCGTFVPEITTSETNSSSFYINKIVLHIKDELRCAVRLTLKYDRDNMTQNKLKVSSIPWFKNWLAKISVKIVVDDKSSLNPGISFTKLLPGATSMFANKTSVSTPQSSSLGLGALVSSEASRTDTLDFYYIFQDDFIGNSSNPVKFDENDEKKCRDKNTDPFISGDLHLDELVDEATLPYFIPNDINKKPPDAISGEREFIVSGSVNGTPSLKLANFSGSTAPFVSAGRVFTADLILTLGPAASDASKEPSPEVLEGQFIALMHSAFSEAIRSQQ